MKSSPEAQKIWRDNNKEHRANYAKKWRELNPEKYKEISLRSYEKRKEKTIKENRENWQTRKINAVEYKGNRCEDCKQTFPYGVYDFHHLNPKEKDLSWRKTKNWESIKVELDKCVLLCANCHRIRHIEERKKNAVAE
jgi:NAD-dependent dihydropyrimidine dehydrogenase PreA subunit